MYLRFIEANEDSNFRSYGVIGFDSPEEENEFLIHLNFKSITKIYPFSYSEEEEYCFECPEDKFDIFKKRYHNLESKYKKEVLKREPDNAIKLQNIRLKTGLNRREFAEEYNIPYRTLEDWESGRRNMPEYTLELIKKTVEQRINNSKMLLFLHNIGGCDAEDPYSIGWDEAISEAISVVEKYTGLCVKELIEEKDSIYLNEFIDDEEQKLIII